MTDRLKQAFVSGLALPLRVMPTWVEAIFFGAMLSVFIQRNPGFRVRLKEIAGKVFYFEAIDLKKGFYLEIKEDDIKVIVYLDRNPDAVMRGEFNVLFGLFSGAVDPDTVFFSRRLEISGDTASSLNLKNILSSL
ncbi:MAG: SCP2 sterol-binding domain-containing protein [Deltaproteobacteria bacterium]|nr:SCP2 sterol-binding domain-containing protein [Deltaproteobacteria bacterium]